RVMPACSSAWSTTRSHASTWARLAISGTTPPYSACRSICENTTLERMRRPFSITAAAVSSQEDSRARMRTCSFSRSAASCFSLSMFSFVSFLYRVPPSNTAPAQDQFNPRLRQAQPAQPAAANERGVVHKEIRGHQADQQIRLRVQQPQVIGEGQTMEQDEQG